MTGAPAAHTPGSVLMAIDIDSFLPVDRFRAETERFCHLLNTTAPAAGGSRVLVPGEKEASTRAERRREGVPLAEATWRELSALTEKGSDSS